MNFYTKFLNKELWNDFQSYFEYNGNCSGCWCMNHRYSSRINIKDEAAKLSIKQLIETNQIQGVLAYSEKDNIPIGWASFDRKATLPAHDCINEKINYRPTLWSIHCISIREDYKEHGVEELLIDATIKLAREHKANEIEAYPEPNSKSEKPFQTWNIFNGHQNTFKSKGFSTINKDYGSIQKFYHPMRLFLEITIPQLETTRLKLEPQSLKHTHQLYKPFQQKELYTFISREPLENENQLREGIRYLKNRMLPDKSEFCLNWVMISKNDDSYIGQVEVSMPVDENYFYLAYTVFLDHQRKGFAKEGCKEIISYMFEHWAAKKVIIEMDIRNTASIKLAESLGATKKSLKPKTAIVKGVSIQEYQYELTK